MSNSTLLREGYDGFTDDLPRNEYVAQQRAVLTQLLRVLCDDGAIWYNHRSRVQNGLAQDPMQDILVGFPVRQTIIWNKKDKYAFNDRFCVPQHENIYMIAKKDFKVTQEGKLFSTVWAIGRERKNSHPAPFPVELPRRCIEASQFNGPVLDPYMGSGTTALAAQQLGHDWVGIEQSSKYVEGAKQRLAGVPVFLPKTKKTKTSPLKKVDLRLFLSYLNAARMDYRQKGDDLDARIKDVETLLKQCKETSKTKRYIDLFRDVKQNLWTLGAFVDGIPSRMDEDNPALVAWSELLCAAHGKDNAVKQVPNKAKVFLELVGKRLEALRFYDTLCNATT